MITKDNFYIDTAANFLPCETPDRRPDFVSNSGSKYWIDFESISRLADHWGHVASCLWLFDGGDPEALLCGQCRLSDFRPMHLSSELDAISTYIDRHLIDWESAKTISAMRSTWDRVCGGRFAKHVRTSRRITIEVDRTTPDFVIGVDGKRIAKHTLSDIRVVK